MKHQPQVGIEPYALYLDEAFYKSLMYSGGNKIAIIALCSYALL